MKRFFVYLFICLWIWSPLAQLRAIPLHVFLGGGTSTSPSGYVPYAAGFDGTDWMRRTDTTVTGLADNAGFTCSFWCDFTGGDGTSITFSNHATSAPVTRLSIYRNTSNKIAVLGRNSSNTTVLDVSGGTSVTASMGWTHVYICMTVATGAQATCKIYINGVAETLTFVTWTDASVLDLYTSTNGRYSFGAGSATTPTDLMIGSLADYWFNDAHLDDVSKFYSAGNPVDLGANGETPTGSSPVFYFSRSGGGDTWATNSGTGGNATVTGVLTTETGP